MGVGDPYHGPGSRRGLQGSVRHFMTEMAEAEGYLEKPFKKTQQSNYRLHRHYRKNHPS